MYHHYLHGSCPPWDLYRLNSSYSSTAFLNCTSQHSCAHGLKALPAVQDSCEKIWRESYGSVQNECMIDLLCKYFFSYCSQMHICVWFFFFFRFLAPHAFELSDWWSYCCLKTYAKVYLFFERLQGLLLYMAHVTQEQTLSHMRDRHRSASPGLMEIYAPFYVDACTFHLFCCIHFNV